MTLEAELRNSVAKNLYDLALEKDYPIHPLVGLEALFHALRDRGFGVVENDSKSTALFTFDSFFAQGESFSFRAEIGYDELLKGGYAYRTVSSPRALHETANLIYKKMGESLRMTENGARNRWELVASQDMPKVKRAINEHLWSYFTDYHENVLLPSNGIVPRLEESKIFPAVFDVLKDELHIAVYDNRPQEEISLDTLLTVPNIDFSIHKPSEEAMRAFFHARFLQLLMQEKQYLLASDKDVPRSEAAHFRELAIDGTKAIVSAFPPQFPRSYFDENAEHEPWQLYRKSKKVITAG